jgi:hypothetical protein
MSNLKEFGGYPSHRYRYGEGSRFRPSLSRQKTRRAPTRPQSLTEVYLKWLFAKLFTYKFLSGFQFSSSKAQLKIQISYISIS